MVSLLNAQEKDRIWWRGIAPSTFLGLVIDGRVQPSGTARSGACFNSVAINSVWWGTQLWLAAAAAAAAAVR